MHQSYTGAVVIDEDRLKRLAKLLEGQRPEPVQPKQEVAVREELAEELVFQPLGMTNSTYTHAVLDLENYAWPHDGSGALEPKPENLEERFARARPHAAATLMTTAPDYARFLVAISKGAALDDARRAELLKPYVDVNDAGSVAWGLGTGLEIVGDSVSAWHWGDNVNSKAFYLVDA